MYYRIWQTSLSWNNEQLVSSLFEKNNLPHIPFHGLRHTSATVLIEKGLPATDVSSRLGHSETTTTMRIYAHAMKKIDKIAAQKLDKILNIK